MNERRKNKLMTISLIWSNHVLLRDFDAYFDIQTLLKELSIEKVISVNLNTI